MLCASRSLFQAWSTPRAAPVGACFLAQPQSGLRADQPRGHLAPWLPPESGFFPTRSTVSAKQQQWQRWPFGALPGWPRPVGPSAGLGPWRTVLPLIIVVVCRHLLYLVAHPIGAYTWSRATRCVCKAASASPGTCWERRFSDPLQTFCFNRLPG